MARRKGDSLPGCAVVIFIVLGAIASIPAKVWEGIFAIGVIGGIAWIAYQLFSSSSGSNSTSADSSERHATKGEAPGASPKVRYVTYDQLDPRRALDESSGDAIVSAAMRDIERTQSAAARLAAAKAERDALIEVTLEADPIARYWLPPDRADDGAPATWIAPGESVTVAGMLIPDGMVYVGESLRSPSGRQDASLIDPRIAMSASPLPFSSQAMAYYPSYASISDAARRTYLEWLARGRMDPVGDMGYVFLFFFGLERRVLVEARTDPAAFAELPLIRAEVRRLSTVYGGNNSFSRYARGLVDVISAMMAHTSGEETDAPPQALPGTDFSAVFKLGLARMAVEGTPLPLAWAFHWYQVGLYFAKRTAAFRCPDEFAKAFAVQYAKHYGTGIKLPRVKTCINVEYRPASPSLLGGEAFRVACEDLPDVTVSVALSEKLQAIGEQASDAIAAYSRFVGKTPDNAGTTDALLLLPPECWPENLLRRIDGLGVTQGGKSIPMSVPLLRQKLEMASIPGKAQRAALAKGLQLLGIGTEPDLSAMTEWDNPQRAVLLFPVVPEEDQVTPAFLDAQVTALFSLAAVAADGSPSKAQLAAIEETLASAPGLNPTQRQRLTASLAVAEQSPPKLAAVKKVLAAQPEQVTVVVLDAMTRAVAAEGRIATAEVKFLEKLHEGLGRDPQEVYKKLQGGKELASPTARPAGTKGERKGKGKSGHFVLDQAKIEALQRETAQVSALLANVFAGESAPANESSEADQNGDAAETRQNTEHAAPAHPWGLDRVHAAFLRAILARRSWSRPELAGLAADMELMLDGALETINEAAFDQKGEPLLEGEDPVEVNQAFVEELNL